MIVCITAWAMAEHVWKCENNMAFHSWPSQSQQYKPWTIEVHTTVILSAITIVCQRLSNYLYGNHHVVFI